MNCEFLPQRVLIFWTASFQVPEMKKMRKAESIEMTRQVRPFWSEMKINRVTTARASRRVCGQKVLIASNSKIRLFLGLSKKFWYGAKFVVFLFIATRKRLPSWSGWENVQHFNVTTSYSWSKKMNEIITTMRLNNVPIRTLPLTVHK